jgi:hypothetical protein
MLCVSEERVLCVEDCMVTDSLSLVLIKFTLALVKSLETDKKKEWCALFLFFSFFFFLVWVILLLRGVRGAACADIGISDECDSVDDLLPRALDPRVLAGLCHFESVV